MEYVVTLKHNNKKTPFCMATSSYKYIYVEGWQKIQDPQEQPPSPSAARSSVAKVLGQCEQRFQAPLIVLATFIYSQSFRRKGTSTRKLEGVRYLTPRHCRELHGRRARRGRW